MARLEPEGDACESSNAASNVLLITALTVAVMMSIHESPSILIDVTKCPDKYKPGATNENIVILYIVS